MRENRLLSIWRGGGYAVNGIVAGMYCASPDYDARLVGKGVQVVTVLSDWRLMAATPRTTIAAIHDAMGRDSLTKHTRTGGGWDV